MEIAAPCVVSLTWRLADAQGVEIDDLTEPVEFFYGGDDLLEKVEEALASQVAGYETTLHLEPEHAFGEYDSELVFFEQRSIFDGPVEPGMQFEGPPPGAQTPDLRDEAIYTVTEVYPDHVVLDGNHPLAGIGLRLSLARALMIDHGGRVDIEAHVGVGTRVTLVFPAARVRRRLAAA